MPPSNCNLINSNCSRSFLNNNWLLSSNVTTSALPGALPNAPHIFAIRYTAFPLRWPAAWCYCIGTKDWFGSLSLSWDTNMAKVLKTLFSEGSFLLKKAKYTPRQHRVTYSTQVCHKIWYKFPIAVFCKVQDASFPWRILNWVNVGGHIVIQYIFATTG